MAVLASGLRSYLPQSNNFIIFHQYWYSDGSDVAQVGLTHAGQGLHHGICKMNDSTFPYACALLFVEEISALG